MASETFTGHTFTKVKNLIGKKIAKPVIYRDADTTGLAIKITKTTASWYYSTRDDNLVIAPFAAFGLADLPTLREFVLTLRREAKKGRNLEVLISAFAGGHSVTDAKHLHAVDHGEGVLWETARDLYLDWAAINKEKDTVRSYKSALGVTPGLHNDFAPIHGKPVASITTSDLARVRNNIIQRGRDGTAKGQGIRQANLTVSSIKACFTYIVNNPDFGVERNPARDLSKALERATVNAVSEERALTQLEIGALWHALLSCRNETVRLILQLQLLTGQRRFTPTAARKESFQLGGVYDCVWSLKDKNQHWRKLALPPVAASIVEQALRIGRNECDYLFPKQRPKKTGDDMNDHINERTVSDKIEDMRKPGGIFEMMPFNVSTHDLRKSFTTIVKPKMSQFELAGRPMLPKEVTMITHDNEGRESVSEKVYDKNVYLDTKMSILMWWQDHVMEGYRMYCDLTAMKKAA
jgi:integrase